MATITIDGKEYNLEDLSDNARAQLASMQVAAQEGSRIQTRMAITQTARNAYARSLQNDLPEKEAAANKKKEVFTIDDKKYNVADFSENAKKHIQMIRHADQKLTALQAELAIANAARVAYGQVVKAELAAK